MKSIKLLIKDNVFDKVIYFLQNYVSIIENKTIKEPFVENENWDYWSEKEIDKIGKIGFVSDSFEKREGKRCLHK